MCTLHATATLLVESPAAETRRTPVGSRLQYTCDLVRPEVGPVSDSFRCGARSKPSRWCETTRTERVSSLPWRALGADARPSDRSRRELTRGGRSTEGPQVIPDAGDVTQVVPQGSTRAPFTRANQGSAGKQDPEVRDGGRPLFTRPTDGPRRPAR